MFSSMRGRFSQIPCPYQNDCKLPNCMFLHAVHQTQGQSPSAVAASSTPEVAQESEISEDDAPRKRQKLDDNKSKDVAEPSSRISTPKPAIIKESSEPPKKENVLAAPKPLTSKISQASSPHLSRNEANKTAVKSNHGATKPKDFYSPIPKPKKAQPQAEALYPRAILPAPAKHDIRLRLVRMLHENFVRLNKELAKDASSKELVLSEQGLITLTLDMEETAAKDKPTIYSNVLKNKILVYKRMTIADWKKERKSDVEAKVAESSKSSSTSNGAQKKIEPAPKPIETGLSDHQELLLLPRLYTNLIKHSPDKHGFVIIPPTPEAIETSLKGIEAANNWECCERCKTRFQVFPGRRETDGVLTTNGPCSFHWGKPFWQDLGQNIKGRGDRKYLCCGEAVGVSAGCIKNEHHVFKITNPARLATVLQFLETPENPELESKLGEKEVLRPVCIDGEMAFTVHGLELVRLTATSWPSGSELLDVLVRPFGEVLDLNTRFSGIWPQQMADAKPWMESDQGSSADLRIVSSPIEARDLLLRLLTPKTPVVGHGLENDLNAVRLVHPTIIDTALLFLHPSGLPYRYALKTLMLKHLGRHIQLPVHFDKAMEAPKTDSTADDGEKAKAAMVGHDSKEDANAAGDLVRYAVGREWEKMKLEGWASRDPEIGAAVSTHTATASSPQLTALTPFETHFIAPRTRNPSNNNTNTRNSKTGMLTIDDLEGRDPTIQAPVRDRRFGSSNGSVTLGGGGRGESSEERRNRERAERRRKDEVQRLKVEEEERERRRGVKRARDGRVIVAYDDLDGARDSGEGEGEGEDVGEEE